MYNKYFKFLFIILVILLWCIDIKFQNSMTFIALCIGGGLLGVYLGACHAKKKKE